MKWKSNKGFSLVELIIVIAIMAILVGVLAPQYIKYVEQSRASMDQNTASAVKGAANAMIADDTYAKNINSGDKITFTKTGVHPSTTNLENGLDEYLADWRKAKAKSRTYNTDTYTVTFTENKGEFTITEGWAINNGS